jgi:3-phosphoshikimate 1-carboxyvinyltransferase
MLKVVKKLDKGLRGEIIIPADKSISHRGIMFSSIAKGQCNVRNFSSGADCHSTLNIFKQLGVNIEFVDEKTVHVKSNGVLNSKNIDLPPLDAGNSGTTTRLIAGILARQNFDSTIIGDESLSKRPMKRIIEPLTLMGAEISSTEGHLPLKIYGRKLQGISYQSKLASAQVKSCILLAGLGAEGKTTFIEPYISRNHTELLLDYLGADINVNKNEVTIYPSELYAKDITVVGDISSAAFFIVAGLVVEGSDFVIKNVGLNPTRAGILDVLKRMGGGIEILNKTICSGEKVGDIRVRYNDCLNGCVIEGDDIPRLIDELPVIAVLASQADGDTVVKNAEDLRNKESDRIKCLVCELTKIGIDIEETADGFIVHGQRGKLKGGAELESYHDHRLAMSFYVAGLISKKEIGINGFEWTKISFPEFEELFGLLVN